MIRYIDKKRILKSICLLLLVGILCISKGNIAYATEIGGIESNLTGTTDTQTNIEDPGTAETPEELQELNVANNLTITYNDGNGQVAGPLRILIILTGIAIAPLLLMTITSFTRIIIVLHFTRTALNTQTSPPNQVLIGIALFLTFFIMSPVLTQINTDAIQPFDRGEITQEVALERGIEPLRQFMYKQTQVKDVNMFMEIAGNEQVQNLEENLDAIPTTVLIPSFIVSELRTAFIIGFLIYIPFIVIDMVVASTLMSMGMMMLPPTTISMPFKILLFVMADGWNLVIGNLVRTFY